MSFLDEVRSDRKPLAHVLKNHPGIRRIVEDLYPDGTHFIYELLQNAEDVGATQASFVLEDSYLSFEHNGRPFSPSDVWGITDIGEGTKAGDDDKIGCFGIGFKAVFAYSETPHIWSPDFAFKIADLVLPYSIESRPELSGKTRFEFPFNNPKKSQKDAYTEIIGGLDQLAETTLLFLSTLESIHWKVDGISGEILRLEHRENHIEILKQTEGKTTSSLHYLRFSKPVEGLAKQNVSIAYELDFLPDVSSFDSGTPLAKQLKIVPATPGQVSVSFPAANEVSGLRFHLHAPFVPELSRASLKDTPANEPLFRQLAELAASSLHIIKQLNLLTVEFLGVLPHSQDTMPLRYQCIRAAIIDEMNMEALTPTQGKSHAPAKHLLQAKAILKELLSLESDLEFLVDYEDVAPKWASSAPLNSSNAARFFSSLAISEWDTAQFIEKLEENLSVQWDWQRPDPNFLKWLGNKSPEWHQKLYALLWADIQATSGTARTRAINRLRTLRIVKLGSGEYSQSGKCYFPTETVTHDSILPRVDSKVYSSGRSKGQQEDAKSLLEKIGVCEVGEVEEVRAILIKRYKLPPFKFHQGDLKRFVAFVATDPSQGALFEDYFIFELDNGTWSKPGEVFLDSPFLETGLKNYYRVLGNHATRSPLAARYLNSGISAEKLIKFANAVGVQTCLKPEKIPAQEHPNVSILKADYWTHGVKRTNSAIDENWIIPELDILLRAQSIDVSRLIWRTMCDSSENCLLARFRPNQQYPTRQQPSSLVLALKGAAWVPQRNGEFVHPADASHDQLPSGFAYDSGDKWLTDIGFGFSERQRSETHLQQQATAKALGFEDEETLRDAQWFASLDTTERQRLREEILARQSFEHPQSDSVNPERRSEKVKQRAGEAPNKVFEKRLRSISVGREDVKGEAEQYLREGYTNRDGVMICQICQGPLPFKLEDGAYYVEKVELFRELEKLHYQNYVALCPNHSAMFQHAHGSREEMMEMFLQMDGDQLEVILAGRDATIFFTQKHKLDLQAVIASERSSPAEKN